MAKEAQAEGQKKDPPVKRRKMREVSDFKKLQYFENSSRVISLKTAKSSDLMLCVRDNQMKFA